MKDSIKCFFDKEGIEYFSILRYCDCKQINSGLMARYELSPKSVIIYLLPYYTEQGKNLSSYAIGTDYHIVIKRINEALINILSAEYPESKFLSFGDHSPIDERHAALSTGLGMLGDNGLLINEKYGSYVFIGEVVSDMEIPLTEASEIVGIAHCPSCGACRSACPTGGLRGEGEDCLSAITQKKGELSENEVALMLKEGYVWGCDVCQLVCPFNEKPEKTPIAEFYYDTTPYLTREILDGMDKVAFSKRAYAWRGRKTIERNLDFFENANKDLQKQGFKEKKQ